MYKSRHFSTVATIDFNGELWVSTITVTEKRLKDGASEWEQVLLVGNGEAATDAEAYDLALRDISVKFSSKLEENGASSLFKDG